MEEGDEIIVMQQPKGYRKVVMPQNADNSVNQFDTEIAVDDELVQDSSANTKTLWFVSSLKKAKHVGVAVLFLTVLLTIGFTIGFSMSEGQINRSPNSSDLSLPTQPHDSAGNEAQHPTRESEVIAEPEPSPPVLKPEPSRPPIVTPTQPQTPTNPANPNKPHAIASQSVTVSNPVVTGNFHLHTATKEHDHPKITLPYPTMGIRQPGTVFNFAQVSASQLYRYETQMDEVFRPYSDTNCELERYGDYGDGGYLVCKNFLNQSVALINLGVEGRDLFGCQVTSAYPMPNYQYDCTNGYHPACSTNNNANFFELACLGEKTEKTPNTQFFSLKDIVDSRNLTRKHVTMKIDIQGGEWPGFRTFPMEYLDYVDQFILEIHNPGSGIHQGAYWGNVDIIRSLGQKFVSVNLHMNNFACLGDYAISSKQRKFPSFAIEVTMVNKKLIRMNSNTRSYKLNDKNHPNSYSGECQMKD